MPVRKKTAAINQFRTFAFDRAILFLDFLFGRYQNHFIKTNFDRIHIQTIKTKISLTMKFSSIALITIVGSVVANPIVHEDAPIFADGPIAVSVTCNGNIAWSKLSLLELSTAGKVLVESYNAIHALVNNDDSQLRDLVYGGNIKRSMIEEGEDSNLDSWFKPRVSKGMSNEHSIIVLSSFVDRSNELTSLNSFSYLC